MIKETKNLIYLILPILLISLFVTEDAFAQKNEFKESFRTAKDHTLNGEYRQAIMIYDEILKNDPKNNLALKLKGLALNNLDEHTSAMKLYHKALQIEPNDVTTLTAMGVSFGSLGEYQEALIYFNKAKNEEPNSEVIKNYMEFIKEFVSKYPYKPTSKTVGFTDDKGNLPKWIQDTTNWWTIDKITDQEFFNILEYMIKEKMIKVPNEQIVENVNELKKISSIKKDLEILGKEQLSNRIFFKNVQWLIDNKLIDGNVKKTQQDLEYEDFLFNKYLRDIENNMVKEKRYIEFPNPSEEVIKKFLRDKNKWNYDQQVKSSSSHFPDPTYQIVNGTYIITYKAFVNEQPVGLPLDHVYSLKNSFEFWGQQELKVKEFDAKMKFEIINIKQDANVWITWVVRDIGEGVLGHAHLGKGVVEVALGDFNCDGQFQLYDIKTLETIMTHELGHTLGLPHTNDRNNIMYPSMTPSYAYCIVD
jgi:tetratricopeptide (TPR) repeat protein